MLLQGGGTFASGFTIPASFSTPTGVVVYNGVAYVSDHSDNTVYSLTDAGTKTSYCTGLTGPAGMAFDSQGRLVVGEGGVYS
jgi:hypothetical protein